MAVWLAQTIWTAICLASITISLFVVMNGALRAALMLALSRKIARIVPPNYAIVGDSLATQCAWRRQLARHPFAVVNLACGGATIKEIAGQVAQANALGAQCIMINGGLNDLLFDQAPIEQIEYDFKAVLRRIGADRRAVVTLVPHVADPAYGARIDQANRSLRALAEQRGFAVVDLNPLIAAHGARRPEMTNDGLHFTPLACAIWIDAVKRELAAANAPAGRVAEG
ncbi:MAG: hypothetical protein HYS06_07020 [Methylocystis sp.]|nr:hypothetical protein [Methylocystis sp.]